MGRRPWTSMVIVAVLAATLVALGGLQYHWTNEIAGAERNRLRNALDLAVNRVRQELTASLLQIASGLHIDPEGNFEDWLNRADPPALVRNVYLVFPDRTVKASEDGSLQDAALPGVLTGLRDQFKPAAQLDPRREGPPDGPPGDLPPPPRRRDRPGPPPRPGGFQPGMWTFFSEVPALGRALRNGYVVIELDPVMFRDSFLKEIVERQFSDRQVAAAPMFNASIGKPGETPVQPYDASVNLLVGRPARGPGGVIVNSGPPLQLVVRHASGSMETAIRDVRTWNLGMGFGVLLILACSAVVLIAATQRAQRLAELQMQFVAGISHELRTPLAVICSAADNLADGIVESKPQITQYGDMIRQEGRRLSGIVEQTLQFAALQSGRQALQLGAVSVEEVVDRALRDAALQAPGPSMEKKIGPGLPSVRADPSALAQCIQNLISNAAKYGGAQGWVGIEAYQANGEILLQVKDKGPGIDKTDLPHIFEPFYRGQSVALQTRGTGLGLNMVKTLMGRMGGRVTVDTSPAGSTFTLHLPSARQIS